MHGAERMESIGGTNPVGMGNNSIEPIMTMRRKHCASSRSSQLLTAEEMLGAWQSDGLRRASGPRRTTRGGVPYHGMISAITGFGNVQSEWTEACRPSSTSIVKLLPDVALQLLIKVMTGFKQAIGTGVPPVQRQHLQRLLQGPDPGRLNRKGSSVPGASGRQSPAAMKAAQNCGCANT